MIMMLAAVVALSGGPIGKFETRTPVADYETPAKMEDVERCLVLMDAGAPPTVYKQADRPNDTMLVWMKVGEFYGVPGARLDLHRTAAGTHVRS